MTETIKISAELIDALNPCSYSYRNRFAELFPDTDERYANGVELTVDVVATASGGDLDIDWFLRNTLKSEPYSRYRNAAEGRHDRLDELTDEETGYREERDAALRAWRSEHEQYSPDGDTSEEDRARYEAILAAYREHRIRLQTERAKVLPTVIVELWSDPDNYSSRLLEAEQRAAYERASRKRQRLADAENNIEHLRGRIQHWIEEPARQLVYWTEEPPKQVAEYTAQLEEAERAIVGLRVAVAAHQAEAARRNLIDLESKKVLAQEAVDAATDVLAEAERAVEAARQQVATGDTTSDAPVAS